MRKVIVLISFLCLLSFTNFAQVVLDDYWIEQCRQWLEENEEEMIDEEFLDFLEQRADNPININDTTLLNLSKIPFITPQQIARIRFYVAQNGLFYSVAELVVVNGIDEKLLSMWMPFIEAKPVDDGPFGKFDFSKARQSLLIGTRRTVEQQSGYRRGVYAGSPWRVCARYRYSVGDRLQVQLSSDKDEGEAFAFNNHQKGFDHYGFHLMVSDVWRVKRLIVGNYKMRVGEGLVLGSAWSPFSSNVHSYVPQVNVFTPGSAFSESRMLNGVATTVGLSEKVHLSLFYSYLMRDATLSADSSEILSFYTSGSHRTPTEISKYRVVNEQLMGGALQYKGVHFQYGASFYYQSFDKPYAPSSTIYNSYVFRGTANGVAGLHFKYYGKWLAMSSELAMSKSGGTAFITRMYADIDGSHQLSLSVRHYDDDFHNFYSNAYTQNSSPHNETGVLMGLMTYLPLGLTLRASTDIFSFQNAKYQVYGPSQGWENSVELTKKVGSLTSITARYRQKSNYRNDKLSMTYALEQLIKSQLQVSAVFEPHAQLRFMSKVHLSNFNAEVSEQAHGIALMQDVAYRNEALVPFRLAARIALFDVDGYDARLYEYENNFSYDFSSTFFYGKGLRTFMVLTVKVNRYCELGLRYGCTYYFDREVIGSSYAQIDTPHKQDVKAHLIIKL